MVTAEVTREWPRTDPAALRNTSRIAHVDVDGDRVADVRVLVGLDTDGRSVMAWLKSVTVLPGRKFLGFDDADRIAAFDKVLSSL